MDGDIHFSSGVIFLQRTSTFKVDQARMMRRNPTPAEKLVWNKLRRPQLAGLKFRRQQIVEGFIVDFFCHSAKLVVEIDGSIHNEDKQKEIDEHRRQVFETRGLMELRFTNQQVFSNMKEILEKIREKTRR
ncbi:MAG: endonuclease domain-containing protein [Chitinispirillaceae bacterium]|jgi:very-short-patch-repair endonuclease|nr:endonuclease domain-containing protein [Chitinispirillaceae bacterium]